MSKNLRMLDAMKNQSSMATQVIATEMAVPEQRMLYTLHTFFPKISKSSCPFFYNNLMNLSRIRVFHIKIILQYCFFTEFDHSIIMSMCAHSFNDIIQSLSITWKRFISYRDGRIKNYLNLIIIYLIVVETAIRNYAYKLHILYYPQISH